LNGHTIVIYQLLTNFYGFIGARSRGFHLAILLNIARVLFSCAWRAARRFGLNGRVLQAERGR
jgi:hypothetical protein